MNQELIEELKESYLSIFINFNVNNLLILFYDKCDLIGSEFEVLIEKDELFKQVSESIDYFINNMEFILSSKELSEHSKNEFLEIRENLKEEYSNFLYYDMNFPIIEECLSNEIIYKSMKNKDFNFSKLAKDIKNFLEESKSSEDFYQKRINIHKALPLSVEANDFYELISESLNLRKNELDEDRFNYLLSILKRLLLNKKPQDIGEIYHDIDSSFKNVNKYLDNSEYNLDELHNSLINAGLSLSTTRVLFQMFFSLLNIILITIDTKLSYEDLIANNIIYKDYHYIAKNILNGKIKSSDDEFDLFFDKLSEEIEIVGNQVKDDLQKSEEIFQKFDQKIIPIEVIQVRELISTTVSIVDLAITDALADKDLEEKNSIENFINDIKKHLLTVNAKTRNLLMKTFLELLYLTSPVSLSNLYKDIENTFKISSDKEKAIAAIKLAGIIDNTTYEKNE